MTALSTCPCNSFPKACHGLGVHHFSVLPWEIFIQTKMWLHSSMSKENELQAPSLGKFRKPRSLWAAGYLVPGPGPRACQEQKSLGQLLGAQIYALVDLGVEGHGAVTPHAS